MGIQTQTGRHPAPPQKPRLHRKLSALLISGAIAGYASNALARSETPWICQPNADFSHWICTGDGINPVQTIAEEVLPPVSPPGQHRLDWVTRDDPAFTECATPKQGCDGAYVQPAQILEKADQEPEDSPLHAHADGGELAQENTATFTGNVQLTQGPRQLRAEQAVINQDTREADVEGNIEFREPGFLLVGNEAYINMDTGEVKVYDAEYVLHESHTRGASPVINRDANEIITLEDGTYTQCEPGSDTWYLTGSEIELDVANGVGEAKHVKVRIKDVPVFYFPYLQFPIDDRRRSGFLLPSIGSTSDGGLDFALPYYFNLAPNYDATFTPRYIGDRGLLSEVEFRHLSPLFETTVGGGILENDDILDRDRWLLSLQQEGGRGQRWSTRIDYTKVSDIDYFDDLGTTGLEASSATHLRQLGQADYRTDNWFFGIRVEEFQTLSDTVLDINRPYEKLPQLRANGRYNLGSTGLKVNLNNEYTYFDHPLDTQVTGQRLNTSQSLSWPYRDIAGFVTPTLKLQHIAYDLSFHNSPNADDRPEVTVPIFSVDSGLFFERDMEWGESNYLHTLEPRLYYLYAEHKDQDDLPDFDTAEPVFSYTRLFRDNRFIGGDRIGDANQISAAVTTRIIDEETGIERLTASIGQIFYFEDREVVLPITQSIIRDKLNDSTSPIAGELTWRLTQDFRITSELTWDSRDNVIDFGSLNFRYNHENTSIFNVGYRFTRRNDRRLGGEAFENNIEQGEIATIWPIADQWRIFTSWDYDFTNQRTLEELIGLEYDDCCWMIRFAYRHWLDDDDIITNQDLQNGVILPPGSNGLSEEYDTGIFLQFQLKGLAGVGSRLSGLLSDSIAGFREPEEN